MFNCIKFLEKYRIEHYSTGYRQCSTGWINLECPFCEGFPYLGINLSTGAVNCYQCGTHSQTKLIAELLHVSISKAEEIRREFSDGLSIQIQQEEKQIKTKLELPYGTVPIGEKHIKYLRKRGFQNPKKIIEEWDLLGTGYLGPYRGRIIAPIYHKGKIVSFQGRDITEKQTAKYKACPKEQEITHHKNYLYGLWKTQESPIIVVEGIVDVWKLGPGAVATFGIEWKREQGLLMLPFQSIYIWFDPEPAAQIQAKKLNDFLTVMGKSVINLDYGKTDPNHILYDPGSLSEREAQYWKNKFLKR